MKINRRSLLAGWLAILPAQLFSGVSAAPRPQGFDVRRTFVAVIDTFVPADESPGAVDIGIDQWLYAKVSANQDYLKQVSKALFTLDQAALGTLGESFAELGLPNRSRLLQQMLSEQKGNVSLQLGSLRVKTISRYYTSETAFEMLDYHPPSQGGYPDYDKPLGQV